MTLKLNLGSGKDARPGYVNVDYVKVPGVDMVADLNQRLPWEDSTVDEVLMSHVLEHVDDPVKLMLEVHRILKKDGVAEIKVPHRSHSDAYSIYHKHYFDEHSLDDLCAAGQSAEIACRFEILELRIYWQHDILSPWHMRKYLHIDTSRWPWGTPKEVTFKLRRL